MSLDKYIEEAKICNPLGSMTQYIHLDLVQQLVDKFRELCPAITHKVTLDWDDETLYRINFKWEPGTFGVKKPIPVLLTAVKTKHDEVPPTPRPSSSRYGGPRW